MTSGAASDIQQATRIAREMVVRYGILSFIFFSFGSLDFFLIFFFLIKGMSSAVGSMNLVDTPVILFFLSLSLSLFLFSTFFFLQKMKNGGLMFFDVGEAAE